MQRTSPRRLTKRLPTLLQLVASADPVSEGVVGWRYGPGCLALGEAILSPKSGKESLSFGAPRSCLGSRRLFRVGICRRARCFSYYPGNHYGFGSDSTPPVGVESGATDPSGSSVTGVVAGPVDDVVVGGDVGSRGEPVALGSAAQVGDWVVSVVSVTPDGTDVVMAENQFNDPPVAGSQFFLVEVEGTYVGAESGSFWLDMTTKALGPSNVAYETFDAWCGVIPDDVTNTGETFPEGMVSGNLCWSVSSEDAGDLLMLLEASFSFDDTRIFYALG